MERGSLAAEFERARPRLRAVAYRMLGSLTEAEDAVQEAWLRLDRSDAAIDDLRAWLVTVVGRISLDMLRARKSRREDYAGSWLPEPIVEMDRQAQPERDAVLADSVGLALLVVLESLAPADRRPQPRRGPPAGEPCAAAHRPRPARARRGPAGAA